MLFAGKLKTHIESFVPKAHFENLQLRAGAFIHPALVDFVESLSIFYGLPVIVNDWATGGELELNGWVPFAPNANPLHTAGASIRFKIPGLDLTDIQEMIIRLKLSGSCPGIKRMKNISENDEFIEIDTLDIPGMSQNSLYMWEKYESRSI